jgi:5-methyltetrahydrofolate--homocysteine methyltransferase
MVPASSVSGFYLWHPQSSYFNLGPINDEQLQDYCSRAGIAEDEGRRRLAPCLGL